jgi:glyoxylase-like metal-dependent hydrolase (beta-lactamase superfamily II)
MQRPRTQTEEADDLMSQTVARLTLGSSLFSVNCYLITTDLGFVLVDTGTRRQRSKLVESLRTHGCGPGSLKLILVTHGDLDHIGSAGYVRNEFRAPIAMHEGDVQMSASGNIFSGRKGANRLVRAVVPLLFRLPEEDRFEPDVLVDEGSDLTEYGLAGAKVLLLRGHSAGSIALLLADGSLLCGDVLENRKSPKLGSIMDDVPTAEAGVKRLKTMDVGTVYPGHGKPFAFADLAAPDGAQ